MTQKDKQLLLKDLCARLPYEVIVQWNKCDNPWFPDCKFKAEDFVHLASPFYEIKPYLRPMSSMTEKERKEYKHLVAFSGSSNGAANLIDWLNKKMFAYRTIDGKDMFELGLVLQTPEGMYNIKEE